MHIRGAIWASRSQTPDAEHAQENGLAFEAVVINVSLGFKFEMAASVRKMLFPSFNAFAAAILQRPTPVRPLIPQFLLHLGLAL